MAWIKQDFEVLMVQCYSNTQKVHPKENQGELKLMAFPPQSRDVNPIEHLWDELKREKVKHEVTSQDSLWDVLSACWNNIEPSTFQNQSDNMAQN